MQHLTNFLLDRIPIWATATDEVCPNQHLQKVKASPSVRDMKQACRGVRLEMHVRINQHQPLTSASVKHVREGFQFGFVTLSLRNVAFVTLSNMPVILNPFRPSLYAAIQRAFRANRRFVHGFETSLPFYWETSNINQEALRFYTFRHL